jgi:hypothetical protein
MSRRRKAVKRTHLPDARYGSALVSQLINIVMKSGKKSIAQNIVYGAIEKVSEKLVKGNPVELLLGALENCRPKLEVKSRRVGGATYQVPVEVSHERQTASPFAGSFNPLRVVKVLRCLKHSLLRSSMLTTTPVTSLRSAKKLTRWLKLTAPSLTSAGKLFSKYNFLGRTPSYDPCPPLFPNSTLRTVSSP